MKSRIASAQVFDLHLHASLSSCLNSVIKYFSLNFIHYPIGADTFQHHIRARQVKYLFKLTIWRETNCRWGWTFAAELFIVRSSGTESEWWAMDLSALQIVPVKRCLKDHWEQLPCCAESATGENQRSDGNVKGKKSKSSENEIPEEVHLNSEMGARMFMSLPTLPI